MRVTLHTLLTLFIASLLMLGARPSLAGSAFEDDTLRTAMLAAGLRSNDLRVRIAWLIDGIEQRGNGNWYSIECCRLRRWSTKSEDLPIRSCSR